MPHTEKIFYRYRCICICMCMSMCMCVYMCVYVYIHTHTQPCATQRYMEIWDWIRGKAAGSMDFAGIRGPTESL